jgi:hypothetical protein
MIRGISFIEVIHGLEAISVANFFVCVQNAVVLYLQSVDTAAPTYGHTDPCPQTNEHQ